MGLMDEEVECEVGIGQKKEGIPLNKHRLVGMSVWQFIGMTVGVLT